MTDNFSELLRNNNDDKKRQEAEKENRKEKYIYQINQLYKSIRKWLEQQESEKLIAIEEIPTSYDEKIRELEMKTSNAKIIIKPEYSDYHNNTWTRVRMGHVTSGQETYFSCIEDIWEIELESQYAFPQREPLDEERFINALRNQISVN